MDDMAERDLERLRSELERSQQRIQELEAQISANGAQQQSHWLAKALNAAHIGVWGWDVALDKVEWSDALYEMYGETRETFGGTREAYIGVVHPEDRERVGKAILGAMTTDQREFFFESRVQMADGSIRHTASYGLAVVGEDGQTCQLTGAGSPRSDRAPRRGKGLPGRRPRARPARPTRG